MRTVRTIITEQMRKRGVGPYDLAKLVRDHVTAPTVYNFVNGKTEMNTKSLAYVLHALGLTIAPMESGTPNRSTQTDRKRTKRSQTSRKG